MTISKGILHISIKEYKAYFTSPIAYIVITILLIAVGVFFFFIDPFFYNNQLTLRTFFGFLPFIFAFVIPAITMHLFAEEKSIGSFEILQTIPVTFMDIIIGKFLAALAFTVTLLFTTLAYPIIISFTGKLDIGPVIGGYTGAVLLGAAYCAIGLFASSITKNQIVSLIVGWLICISLWLFDKIIYVLPRTIIGFFQFFSSDYHFANISKGIVDFRDIIYFISISFIALYITKLILAEKK